MCFSATASFLTGGALAGVGIANRSKIRQSKDYPLATIPFIFSAQQIVEGFVWLTANTTWQIYFAYAFVIIAFLFWPLFVPLAFFWHETDRRAKRQMSYFIPIGLGVSAYLTFFLVTNTLHFTIQHDHVQYYYDVIGEPYVMAVYLLATVIPPLLSSSKFLNLFGLFLGIAYLVAFVFFYHGLFSVWCFFAAILSTIILMHFYLENSHR